MKIKLDPGARIPTRAHDTDAGYDLYAREDMTIPFGGSAVFDTGVSAVCFVTDGRFCDGGEKRRYGFTRFDRGTKITFSAKNACLNKLENLRASEGIHLYD